MSSKPTDTGPRIDNPTSLDLSPQEESILRAMFSSYRRVTVKERLYAGLSGSRVFTVRPIASEDQPELPAVVKIGPRALIQREWEAYRACVHQKLPGIAEISGEPILPAEGPLGGLRYALMGEGGTFDVESLRSYYDHASVDDVRFVLEKRLFEIVGPKWWQFNEAKADWPIQASYDSVLPVNLRVQPVALPHDVSPLAIRPDALPGYPLTAGDYVHAEGFVVTEVDAERGVVTLNVPPRQDGLPASYRVRLGPVTSTALYEVGTVCPSVEGRIAETRLEQLQSIVQGALEQLADLTAEQVTSPEGVALPNPLCALPDLLAKTRNVKVSCIHGDLNLENVLVEPTGRNISLIDFATARRDHVLHDLLRLETEVVTKLLPQALGESGALVETVCSFYRQLHSASFNPAQRLSAGSLPTELAKPFAMVVAIRSMTRQCLFDLNEWAEYYEGLVLYLLGALKFANLGRLAKRIAFWSAAAAYDLLAPTAWSGRATVKDWGRLQKYLPGDMYQHRNEAACLAHLNALLRAVLTYIPRQVVLDLLREPVVAHNKGHFLEGTLLFADISGFTALSDRLQQRGEKEGAEGITWLINEYLDVMLGILFRYEGQLIKFGGDAMLCLFSGPGQGAMNAIWAAWEMKQAMLERFARVEISQEAFPLQMKVGSNSGLLFAADVGTAEHMEYVLSGSAVERTARAEASAQRGDILVSAETYALVVENLEAEQIAGLPDFYRVMAILSAPSAAAVDSWSQVLGYLSALEDDLWRVTDRLDALSPYLPVGVLQQLAYDPQGGQIEGQHRPVTVLFANFVGMSDIIDARGTHDEAGISADLGEYFRAMQEEVQYYGGVINKVDLYDQGDKLMVIFGAPVAHEQDVRRAALTALAMQEAMRCLSSPTASTLLRQRIGIHTGFVYAGNVGSAECNRREYTVMGGTVNLAARLMSAAPLGEVWISQRVWDQIRGDFQARTLASVSVAGFPQPIPVYRLESAPDVLEDERRAHALRSEIVGRQADLDALEERYENLTFGEGKQIVAICGEAGVGKSRLVGEWYERCVKECAATWLTGRGHPYGQQTHGVFVEILEGLLGFAEGDSPDDRWNKLSTRVRETLEGAPPGWIDAFSNRLAYLGHFLGLDLARRQGLNERVAQLEAESLQIQTRLVVCALLEHAARDQPLVLVLEDLHWADDASLDLLTFAVDQVSDAAAVLFCLIFRRQTELPIWQAWQAVERTHPDCRTIQLQELEIRDGRQLLFNLLGTEDLAEDFIRLLLDSTDGNPLYVEEVLHALIEGGVLVREGDGWRLTQRVERIEVPATLYQIIQSRVDELDFVSPGARRVLWMASVIGDEFTEDLLLHLFTQTGRRAEECRRHLRALRKADMVDRIRSGAHERTGRVYRFRHGLVREVAYENILLSKQREYHRLVGRWLEGAYGDDLSRHYDVLAHHYDQGQSWHKAFHYRRLAGTQAAEGYANQQAAAHLRRALQIAAGLTPDGPVLAQVHLTLGKVLQTAGHFDAAIEHLEQAHDLLAETGTEEAARLAARACYEIGYTYELKGGEGNLERALSWQARGLALVPAPETAEGAWLHALGGLVRFRQARFGEAVVAGQEALRLAQAAGAPLPQGSGHRLLSMAYRAQGDLALAMEHCQRGIEISQEIGDLLGLVRGYSNRGVYAFEADDWRLAESSYLQAIELLERVGDRFELGKACVNLGDLYQHLGEVDAGLAYAGHALAVFGEIGSMAGTIIARAVLATLLWRQGAYGEARRQLSEASWLARSAPMFKPTVGRWLAQVYLSGGKIALAEAKVRALLGMDLEVLEDEAEPIQILRGQVLAARGRGEKAREVLEESLRRLEARGARYQAGQARLALGSLLAGQDGREGEARVHAELAREIFADLGARLDVGAAEELLGTLQGECPSTGSG